jgi:hypothetical protein
MQYLVHPVVYKSSNRPGSEATKSRCYAIVAVQTGMVAGLQSSGQYLEQQAWATSTRQMFRFIPVASGYVEIEVVETGKVLAVESKNSKLGARIIEQERDGGLYQQFRLMQNTAGLFQITARVSNMALDLANYADGQGAIIYQYMPHGRDNQQWLLSEVVFDRAYEDLSATVYEETGYTGNSQTLGIGSYTLDQLTVANDSIASLQVPAGLRVTLHEHDHFKGNRRFFDESSSNALDLRDQASSIIVEQYVTVFSGVGFAGDSMKMTVGSYIAVQLDNGWIGNDRIKSIKVPPGMLVVAFENDRYQGEHLILLGDEPTLPSGWANRISSLIIKQLGVIVPAHSIRYGGKFNLRTPGRIVIAKEDGTLGSTNIVGLNAATFEIVRSGPTTLRSHVCYGDIVSLRSIYRKYVVAERDGSANANRDHIGEWEKFRIMRAGDSTARSFVCEGDVIALQSVAHGEYLGTTSNGGVRASATSIGDSEKLLVRGYVAPNQDGDGAGAAARTSRTSSASVSACGANVCVTEACIADACGAASCNTATTLTSVCAAAASGIVACAVDVGMVSLGGITACVAAIDGVTVCGADFCGAAVCGAAACAAAVCGAAGCGADACGSAASILSACGANAGGLSMCGADACVLNACGVNLCPVDACAADVCGVDLVPVIPFI